MYYILLILLQSLFNPLSLRGVLSYLTAALLFYIAGRLVKLPKLTYLVFAILSAINLEHIKFNGGNISLNLAKYLGDQEFVKNSISFEGLTISLSIILIPLVSAVIIKRMLPDFKSVKLSYIVVAFIIFSTSLHFIQSPVLATKTQHYSFLEENINNVYVKVRDKLDHKFIELEYSEPLNSKTDSIATQKNLLIIFIESVSSRHLDENWMPYFSSLRNNNFHLTEFYANQKMTHNGLYSSLCGKQPFQTFADEKTNQLVQENKALDCLPRRLRSAGYETYFLQGANLHFMNKRKLTSLMGFEHIKGSDEFDSNAERSSWGLTDEALYLQTIKTLSERSSEKPWFASVLTVSTHHPYDIPNKKSGFIPAFRYADRQLEIFIKALEDSRVLDNTTVVITSDEVSIVAEHRTDNILQFNHIPLVIIDKTLHQKPIESAYSQVDLMPSMLDHLGLDYSVSGSASSFFHPIERAFKVVAGMIHARYFFLIDKSDAVIACDRMNKCQKYKNFNVNEGKPDIAFEKLSKEQANSVIERVHGLEVQY